MSWRFFPFVVVSVLIAVLTGTVSPSVALAQTEETGFIVGRVYEVAKEKYRDYIRKQEQAAMDEEKRREITAHAETFLIPRSNVEVLARHVETDVLFAGRLSNESGDYLVPRVPPGVFEFTLLYNDEEYPVRELLGAKVNLGFVAELCFVLDVEEKTGWMISSGPQRSPDVPPWVPQQCRSPLGDCLAAITGDLPEGLLLLFAGGGAATGNIVIDGDEEEVSPVVKR